MIKRMDVELMILTVNAFFLAILLLSIFGIGTILYNRNVGLLAALLTSFFPSMFGFSRTAMLDFPLACMVTLSFFLLLKTNGFTSGVYSMLFGAVAGLSMLTKETAILFLIAPTSYYFMKTCLAGHKRQVIFNMLTALLCFFFVAGTAYFHPDNFQIYDFFVKKIIMKAGEGGNSRYVFYYLQALPDLVGPWFLISGIPLLIHYFIRLKKQDGFLSLWCLIPILLFSFSLNQSMRFILPITPALALILAREALVNTWSKGVRRACVLVLAVLSATQYGFYQAGHFGNMEELSSRLERGILSAVRQEECLRVASKLFDIFKNEAPHFENRKILFLLHGGEVSGSLEIQIAMAHLNFQVETPLFLDTIAVSAASPTLCSEEMLGADYVVVLEGVDKREPNPDAKQLGDCLDKNFSEHRNDFKKITEGIAYNHSLIYVYERIRR
ncbi:MAG: glycosyltransferase family 39 protein [Candidatus Omnitrophota bacterium]